MKKSCSVTNMQKYREKKDNLDIIKKNWQRLDQVVKCHVVSHKNVKIFKKNYIYILYIHFV